jgi:hypothetical protein
MLRQMERSPIHLLAKRGRSLRQIAQELGRSPTTVARVLREPVDRPPARRRRWLTLAALPEVGALPAGWAAAVAQRGHPSLITLALALLDHLQDLPLACLPTAPSWSGYA